MSPGPKEPRIERVKSHGLYVKGVVVLGETGKTNQTYKCPELYLERIHPLFFLDETGLVSSLPSRSIL